MSDVANPHASGASAIPPKIVADSSRNSSALTIGVVALAGACAALYFFNPAEHAFYPQCFFHQATGLQCPGCGGLRAVHQLLHGHLLAALHLNALAVFLFPIFGALFWREFQRRKPEVRSPRRARSRWVWVGLAILILFSVLRNFPAFAFLAP